MKSPRRNNDTTRLGYTITKEGESFKSGEQRNNKGKNYKPTCHNYGKIGHTKNICRNNKFKNYKPTCHNCRKLDHTTNVCRSNNENQNPKHKFKGYYHK